MCFNSMCEFDIIMEGGQSNAEGSGFGPVCVENEFLPYEKIMYLDIKREVIRGKYGNYVEYPDNKLVLEIAKERIINKS